MSETQDKEKEKKTLSLGGKGTLSLKPGGAAPRAPAVQSITPGRGRKGVAVEVRRNRSGGPARPDAAAEDSSELHQLTSEEREARLRALKEAEEESQRRKEEAKRAPVQTTNKAEQDRARKEAQESDARAKEMAELQKIEQEERRRAAAAQGLPDPTADKQDPNPKFRKDVRTADEEEEESYRERMKRHGAKRPARTGEDRRRTSAKITVTQVLNEDYERERGPSLAAQKRARERARMALLGQQDQQKIVREVIVPETITVQDLANRMAERGIDVIKELMKLGVMATINETIDADTAELLVTEFGHKIKRVAEGDIEQGLEQSEDAPENLKPRPPVVTVMGHVDHGKTSLLDAMRSTDVVSGEAGGITQHIGAYQVTMKGGEKITFLDTPGHAAFTEMRARGANVTDIVVLVVAANDSIMPQTVEAINHAKAANVPMIVAINKIDLPDANPQKVKQDLLQHEVIAEDFGGPTPCVEISAKKKMNLSALEEIILLQADILELKANPDRMAEGTVVEARLEQGRGHVATVLVQKGTLKNGDIFVVGSEWGRVRAMSNDRGQPIKEAIPGEPVEVIGLQGAPEAGDRFIVINDESKARDISEYRQHKKRTAASVKSAAGKSTADAFEQLLAAARDGKKQTLAVIIKGDVHGSVEAIEGSLRKIEQENEDIAIKVLHAGTGGIIESDVTLANASNALIIGFNVRANVQAREMAERDGIQIRYYNIIYNVIDDVKKVLSGMLAPTKREEYLGQAEIKQVFRITKVGNVAGCVVTAGTVKRGAKVRLLRDNVVIHEGTLKTLKRHKDEVKEVKEGTECGMAFENYDDIKEKDVIECYEIVEESRSVE